MDSFINFGWRGLQQAWYLRSPLITIKLTICTKLLPFLIEKLVARNKTEALNILLSKLTFDQQTKWQKKFLVAAILSWIIGGHKAELHSQYHPFTLLACFIFTASLKWFKGGVHKNLDHNSQSHFLKQQKQQYNIYSVLSNTNYSSYDSKTLSYIDIFVLYNHTTLTPSSTKNTEPSNSNQPDNRDGGQEAHRSHLPRPRRSHLRCTHWLRSWLSPCQSRWQPSSICAGLDCSRAKLHPVISPNPTYGEYNNPFTTIFT